MERGNGTGLEKVRHACDFVFSTLPSSPDPEHRPAAPGQLPNNPLRDGPPRKIEPRPEPFALGKIPRQSPSCTRSDAPAFARGCPASHPFPNRHALRVKAHFPPALQVSRPAGARPAGQAWDLRQLSRRGADGPAGRAATLPGWRTRSPADRDRDGCALETRRTGGSHPPVASQGTWRGWPAAWRIGISRRTSSRLRGSSSGATLKVRQQKTLCHAEADTGNVWGVHCDSFLGCELACRGSRPLCQRFEPRNRAAVVPARYKVPGPAGPGPGAQAEFAAAGWGACCSRHPNPLSPCGRTGQSPHRPLQPEPSQGKEPRRRRKHRDLGLLSQVPRASVRTRLQYMPGASPSWYFDQHGHPVCRDAMCAITTPSRVKCLSCTSSVLSVPLWLIGKSPGVSRLDSASRWLRDGHGGSGRSGIVSPGVHLWAPSGSTLEVRLCPPAHGPSDPGPCSARAGPW